MKDLKPLQNLPGGGEAAVLETDLLSKVDELVDRVNYLSLLVAGLCGDVVARLVDGGEKSIALKLVPDEGIDIEDMREQVFSENADVEARRVIGVDPGGKTNIRVMSEDLTDNKDPT